MTFSITAKCQDTGQFGIAIATRLPAVGSLCPFLKAGIGAIASQAFVNPYIGINGLKFLEAGLSSEELKEKIIKEDLNIEHRQFVIIDKDGNVSIFSGERCHGWYGDIVGEGYGVAGNMLVGEETILEASASFEKSKNLPLAERLLLALEAGQKAGGDKRGRQSAAIKVVDIEAYPLIDLRVDDDKEPIKELWRIYEIAKGDLFPFMDMLRKKEAMDQDF